MAGAYCWISLLFHSSGYVVQLTCPVSSSSESWLTQSSLSHLLSELLWLCFKLTLEICPNLLTPFYSLASSVSAGLLWTVWTHEWTQFCCTALTLNWLNRTVSLSLYCSSGLSFLFVFMRADLISDLLCQIFLWFVNLSAPQLDVPFKHDYLTLQTNLPYIVRY